MLRSLFSILVVFCVLLGAYTLLNQNSFDNLYNNSIAAYNGAANTATKTVEAKTMAATKMDITDSELASAKAEMPANSGYKSISPKDMEMDAKGKSLRARFDTKSLNTPEMKDSMADKSAMKKDDMNQADIAIITAGDSVFSGNESKILFGFNSTDLTSSAKETIASTAMMMINNEHMTAYLRGNTDTNGDIEVNEWFSAQRAKTVAMALKELGVAQDRIITKAMADTAPLASNGTWQGRQMNRRVDIELIY